MMLLMLVVSLVWVRQGAPHREVRWLANDAVDASRVFGLGAAGCLSS